MNLWWFTESGQAPELCRNASGVRATLLTGVSVPCSPPGTMTFVNLSILLGLGTLLRTEDGGDADSVLVRGQLQIDSRERGGDDP